MRPAFLSIISDEKKYPMKPHILFILLLAGKGLFAQNSLPEDLKTLVNQSFLVHPQVQVLNQQEAIQEQRVALAQSGKMPVVNATANYLFNLPVAQVNFPTGPNGELQTLYFQPYNNVSAVIQANYLLLDFGQVATNISKSQQELQVTQDQQAQLQTQLASQIAQLYYGVLYLRESIRVQDSVLGLLADTKKQVQAKIAQGDALQLDVLNLQSTIANEENRKSELQTMLKTQLTNLQYATSMDQVSGPLSFDFIDLAGDADSLLGISTSKNPEFELARDRIQVATFDKMLAEKKTRPSLGVVASTGLRNGFQPDITQIRPTFSAGLSFSYLLFDGKRNQNNISVADANIQLQQANLQSLEEGYSRDLQNALDRLSLEQDRLKNADVLIEQSKLAYRISNSRYLNGMITQVDLLNAVNQMQRAQLNQLTFAYQACLAKIELARLSGSNWWE